MRLLELCYIAGASAAMLMAGALIRRMTRKIRRRALMIVAMTAIPCVSFLLYLMHPDNVFEQEYQQWADLCRINAVHRIGDLVERYHEKTGKYPGQGSTNVPVEVRLSCVPLRGEAGYPPHGQSGIVLEWHYLAEALGDELGYPVTVPVDPQKVGVAAPNFLQYYTDHTNYYLSANLYSPTRHTRRLGDHYHKYQVGSVEVPDRKIRKFKDIPEEEKEAIKAALEKKSRKCPEGIIVDGD